MSKLTRQRIIRELVGKQPITSQDDLRRLLAKRGHAVTQATLSRDIHELGLAKTNVGYSAPQDEIDLRLPSVERLVREFADDAKAAQNMVVVRTSAGAAQPVAAAIDAEEWPEIVGTVGGDDTIFIVCPDNSLAEKLVERLQELIH